MKPNLTAYLFSAAILFSLCAQAQNDSTIGEEKSHKIENPFKKGQTKWLNKNQFFTEGYDWKDPTINLYLNQSVKRRSTSKFLGITGGSVLFLGLVSNLLGSVAKSINSSHPNEPFQPTTWPYYVGGTIAISSLVLSLDANSKLEKAKALQKARFKNK